MSAKIIKRNSDVVFRKEGERTVVFNPETGGIHELNETASLFWEICDNRSLPEICTIIREDYDVPSEVLEKDLSKLVRVLARHKLVKVK